MKINTREDLLRFLSEHRNDIRAFKVNKLGLFGSFVRDEQSAESDIDLIVEYEEGFKTIDNFLGLIDFLEENSGRTVELLTPESINQYLKPHIEKEVEYVNILP